MTPVDPWTATRDAKYRNLWIVVRGAYAIGTVYTTPWGANFMADQMNRRNDAR